MKQIPSQQPEREVQYFVPGQVLLLVEPPSRIDANDIPQLIEGIRGKSFAADLLRSAEVDPKRVLIFDHVVSDNTEIKARESQQQAPRSFLPSNRSGQAFDVRDLRRASQEQFALVPFMFRNDNQEPRQLKALIDELNAGIRTELGQLGEDLGDRPSGELLLRGAAPNWLTSPSQHWAGVGSPGARPAPGSEDAWQIELLNMPAMSEAGGQGVHVAILDTAPSELQLRCAHGKWVNEKSVHPLLQNLLGKPGAFAIGPNSPLELITAADLGIELPSIDDFRVRDHDYPMSDHGLFAAGIINSIAPNAHLQLIEVLNEYGIGTLESIGRALQQLLERRKRSTNPLVVNMSLTLAMPLEGHPRPDYDWSIFEADTELVSLSLEWMCAALRGPSVALVAAAGNDADEPDATRKPPQARYPAAFPTVIGVGALLEDSDEPTEYSNLADAPEGDGVWTFGGKAENDDVEKGSGMLGVYIGEFPTELDPHSHGGATFKTEPSKSGWGWWAGTSFAAPVVSGTLAALAGSNNSLSVAEDTFDESLIAGTVGGLLRAKQGGS